MAVEYSRIIPVMKIRFVVIFLDAINPAFSREKIPDFSDWWGV